ncbi:ABC transporter permease [Paenibacillus sp. UMB4589-SE434]|uniref:ABC transporter permease n=1 Tax=Paenibacillus sp. UMB4589-SE434 TaxID=3046314 RepID=UPI00254EA4CD|nr:ABC transporter permease [Paenibacillus sp. UMB4589-SE434]MDK8181677.1 ABC transporter permease [Paenibacillus sp. UMB4589-SE434]
MINSLRQLYAYRQMLYSLVLTDLRTRYKGSLLGFLWTFLNPLLMLVVYSVIFSTIMRINIENYPMFLFIGLLSWNFFSNSIIASAGVVIRQGNLVKKIYFPRIILPLSVVGAGLVNFLLSIVILVPALYLFGLPLSVNAIYFLLILVIQTIFTIGLSFIVSSLNVYFRDLEHILTILLMVWFYLTPVLYTADMVPVQFKYLFELNPMNPIITAYHNIFYDHITPDFLSLAIIFIIGIIMLISGSLLFQRLQKKFAEEL